LQSMAGGHADFMNDVHGASVAENVPRTISTKVLHMRRSREQPGRLSDAIRRM